MAVDLCYIVSHGFATRMLLQTKLLDQLSKSGYSIAVVCPDSNDPNLLKLSENNDITLIQWNAKTTIWDDNYLHKRMYYLEDIRSNTALLEKFYNGLFYSTSLHPWKRIRPIFYFIIYSLIPFFPVIRKKFLANESKHLDSKEGQNILEKIEPKLVVSTYPVSIIEAKILHEAKKKNIKTIQHLLSWDNISCKGKFPVLGDFFIAWGEIMKEELQEYYNIPSKNIDVCGVPHFDQHIASRKSNDFQQILSEKGLAGDDPYLFFAMSSPRFAPREIDVVSELASAVESNILGDNMQLIIRPHPQNMTTYLAKEAWLKRLDAIQSNRVGIDYPKLAKSKIRWSMESDDMRNLSSLIAGCSLCYNSGSTVSIDALMHDKPVIITAFDGNKKLTYWNSAGRLIDYPHLKKFIAEGGATVATSFDDLLEKSRQYIENPEYNLARRRNALLRECFKDDGASTNRVLISLTDRLESLKA